MASLTPELARAAGRDAANERMRAAGRSTWNRADYNHAVKVTNRLMQQVEGRWVCGLSPLAQRAMEREIERLKGLR